MPPVDQQPRRSRLKGGSYGAEAGSEEPVRGVLLRAAFVEQNPGNLRMIDEALKEADGRYRTSFERETVLQTIGSTNQEGHREYATHELMLLGRVPQGDRTHIAVGE